MKTILYRIAFGLLVIILFSIGQSYDSIQAQNFTKTFSKAKNPNTTDSIEIVGGQNVPDPNPYKWQVSIGYRGVPNEDDRYLGHFCGGSVIAERWILTAAHCMEYDIGQREDPADLRVIIGRRVRSADESGIEINVLDYTLHDDYRSIDSGNDIALVQLEEPIPNYADYIVPLMRSHLESELAAVDTMSTITGWGGLKGYGMNSDPPRDQTFPDVLQWVEIPIVSLTTCNHALDGGIRANMVCAGFAAGGKDSCQNDSGGPLVIPVQSDDYMQLGIVSFGLGCAAPNSYGVYTRVSSFIDWIEETIGTTLISPPNTPTSTATETSTSTATSTATATPTPIPTEIAIAPTDAPEPTEISPPLPTGTPRVTPSVTPKATTTAIPPNLSMTPTSTIMPSLTPSPTRTPLPTDAPAASGPLLNRELDPDFDPIYDPANLFKTDGPTPVTITETVALTGGVSGSSITGMALDINLLDSTPTAGHPLHFALLFENRGDRMIHGAIVWVDIPIHSRFQAANSGMFHPSSRVPEDIYSANVHLQGAGWELTDGSGSCPDGYAAKKSCLFRLGTISPGEIGALAFNILLDGDIGLNTNIVLNISLEGADLADKMLITLVSSTSVQSIEPLSNIPTALAESDEFPEHHDLFLPFIMR